MSIFLLWIVFCFIAGFVGSERKIGFWSTFFASLFLSPLIGLIIAFNSEKKADEELRQKALEAHQSQIEVAKYETNTSELERISNLKEKGFITEDEFNTLKEKIINPK